MKFYGFKIFKFSTILKKAEHIKDSLLSIYKVIKKLCIYTADFIINIFYIISKNFKNINRESSYKKLYKYLDVSNYNFNRISKNINLKNYKLLPVYFSVFIIFFIAIYLVTPKFYNYNKSKITKIVCNKQKVECLINGKIYYSFFPTPSMKIENLIIKDPFLKKNVFLLSKETKINLSLKNLIFKDKHEYKKIKLNNYEINFNLNKLKEYQNVFNKKNNLLPVKFGKGKIIFFDEKNYVATIDNAKLKLKFKENAINSKLKGKFLNDDLYFDLNSEIEDNKRLTDIVLKISNMNLVAKINIVNPEKEKNPTNGNLSIKKNKSKVSAVFNYEDSKFKINKSNLRNTFLDGKAEGVINFLPYFNFNLDLNLNSINFTKLYSFFLSLSDAEQKKLFKISNKINGKINLSSEKIYSSYNLIKSIESRIKFTNGNILVDQLLLNLGKLGAADVTGVVNNEKKINSDKTFTNFRFESNVFIDNQKKFLSKFGIYNKENISSDFFISGNFDLENLRTSFYEISAQEKLNDEDINFVENEFNVFMLEDGLKSLFLFPKFKEFLKSATAETN